MFFRSTPAKVKRLEKQLAEEQAAHEATRRELRVAGAEIDAMAVVIARDRQRVQAEAAEFGRRRAEAEGTEGNGRYPESVSRL